MNELMKSLLQRDPEGPSQPHPNPQRQSREEKKKKKKKKKLHRAHATTSQRTAGYRKVATD
jgi:hypothetical protein